MMIGIAISLSSFAQRTVKVCGEAEYVVPSTISLEDAKRIVADRARQNALAEKFGTDISVTNVTHISNVNEQCDVLFHSFGESSVKGIWLGDNEEPVYEYTTDTRTGQQTIIAKICGRARERKGSEYSLIVKTLCNSTSDNGETTSFKDGDDFFISLLTPVDGYIAIYLVDAEQNAYCIYPYSPNGDGCGIVRHGKRKVFFSEKEADDDERNSVNEYTLTSNNSVEYNKLYVVFSTNKFTKANGINTNGLDMLSETDFLKWLTQIQRDDEEMKVEHAVVKITK